MSDIEGGALSDGGRKIRLELYKAALSNDWKKAERIYKKPGTKYGAIITSRGETALHVAAYSGHTDFVEKLVQKMNEHEIRIQMKIAKKRKKNEGETTPEEDGLKNRTEFFKAALDNDWMKAEILYEKTEIRSELEKPISIVEAAVHVSSLAGHADFARKLATKMREDESESESESESEGGNTAFHCAVISGNVKIAEAILSKDDNKLVDLAMSRGFLNFLPIYMAAVKGNKKMVIYLYEKTKHQLQDLSRIDLDGDRKTLLLTLINSDIYDVALEMAKALIEKSIAPESMEEEALQTLAEKPLKLFLYCELVQLLWDEITKNEKRVSDVIHKDKNLIILKAAKQGNFEFLSILIASYPDVLFTCDNNSYTIFHHAILNRHVDIFNMIRIGSVRTIVTTFRDNDGNNMLHLAGKLPPSTRLNIVPGAALQLQLELLWFKEVKKVMEPHEVMRKVKLVNDKKTQEKEEEEYTPHELFLKEHKDLMAEGEKWMRDTANSCMIVTALITTIAFAAAITVPGGNGDDGYPHFASETLFDAFAIADSISLISSTTSLLSFLSILTARYRIDDFRWTLPNKLFIGLSTLFVSIVAMMVAFVLAVFIIFKNTPLFYTILLAAVSSVPIIIFCLQHIGLFVDVFRSTYVSCLLFTSIKHPNELIKEKRKRGKYFLSLRACGKVIIDC